MTARRLQSWVWWLLPLLVARALMPVGFMPQVVHGQMQIVLCQSGVARSVAADQLSAIATTGQIANSDSSAGNTHWQHDVSCPFGHVAAAPPPVLVALWTSALAPQIRVDLPAEPPYDAAGPPRFIATRGPPAFA